MRPYRRIITLFAGLFVVLFTITLFTALRNEQRPTHDTAMVDIESPAAAPAETVPADSATSAPPQQAAADIPTQADHARSTPASDPVTAPTGAQTTAAPTPVAAAATRTDSAPADTTPPTRAMTDDTAAPTTTAADQPTRRRPVKDGIPRYSVPDLLARADLRNPADRARVVAAMKAAEQRRYAAVLERAAELGIPVRKEGPGHQVAILHDIRGEEPLYRVTMNRNAAISSAADQVYPAPYNLTGAGLLVGVWDAGPVLDTHREFGGRITNQDTGPTDDHATHVAGTVAASGVDPDAKGMAPAVDVDAYDWNSDYAEMTAAGAATANETGNVPLSNHSYGYNAVTSDMGVYEDEARTTDAIAHDLPYYMPYWAAGNEQDLLTAKDGYQSITFNGLAKNIMTIGAVNDAVSGGNRSLAAATMSYFSSWGPADDGRIKPDLVANGVDVYSTVNSGNSAYDGTYSGTSMATPSAMGSSALLVELYRRELGGTLPRASTLKALLIHTADDLGTAGPDYQNGWGLINTKAAADVILEHSEFGANSPRIIEASLSSATPSRTYTFGWDGESPIRATLVWTDPEGSTQADNSRTPVLVNNLDLRITAPDGSTVYQPYVMPFVGNWSDAAMSLPATTGDNNVDNVERIDIDNPSQTGTYTLTVTLDGSLTGASQVFSLIIGGRADANQPPRFDPLDDRIIVTGRAVSIPVVATDPIDNDPITLTATNLPGDATFSAVNGTGTFSWASATPAGSYTPTFSATDTNGTTTASFTMTVQANQPPVLEPIADQLVTISNALSFAVTATDPVGEDPISLTASNLPGGATFNATGGDGTFTWNAPAPVGVYNVSFIAADMAGAVTQTVYITVEPEPVYAYGTNNAVITLTDASTASPYPSTISIDGVEGVIRNVAVTLDGFTHEWPSDMTFLLVGPEGQKAIVMGEQGGSEPVTDLTLTLDDRAETEPGFVLESGTWKPAGAIADALPAPAPGTPYPVGFTNLIGASPNGTWSLYANDPYGEDDGSVSRGWSLQIQVVVLTNQPPVFSVTNPEPVPVGSDFELTVTANDLTDNDVITLSADSLPPGAVFNPVTNASTATGTMIWNNAGPTGSYTAVFRALDENGTTTRTVPIEVFLPPPPAPEGLRASVTNNNDFTATWNAVAAADSYRLDVSTNSAFESSSDVGEPLSYFYHSGTPGSGSGGTWTEENVSGNTYLIMIESDSRVTTPTVFYEEAITEALTFQARTYGGSGNPANVITVSISIDDGVTWALLGTRTPENNRLTSQAPFDLSAYANQSVTLKFETRAGTGSVGAGISQIELDGITYNVVSDFLPGYSNLTVNGTSQTVSGLTPASTYYFRARAVNGGGASSNSETASVTTTFTPEPPVFTSSAGPFTNQTGTAFTLPVTASGLPAPTISRDAATASGGYSFTSNTLAYTPPLADIGTQTFTLRASNDSGATTQVVTVVVTAGPPPPPASVWASETNDTSFTAAWTPVDGATSYRLDVATTEGFGEGDTGSGTLAEDLFISEYIEGSSNNKAIEIYNGTGAPVDLSAYALAIYFNGNTSPGSSITLDGTLAHDDVLVVANSSANSSILAVADLTSGSVTHNGNDAVTLTKNGAIIDILGEIGDGTDYAKDVTKIRLNTIDAGVTVYNTAEWNNEPSDTSSDLGRHTFIGGGGGSTAPAYVPGYSNLTVNGTSQPVTGLQPGTSYYFRVRAANANGIGANSDIASVTTIYTGPPVAPTAPANIWAATTNATEFLAAWSSVANASQYRLDVSTNATFLGGGSGAVNLMTNPGFESGDSAGWDKVETGYTVVTADPRSGSYCLQGIATGTRDLAQTVAIPTADGSTAYEISYWYRIEEAGDGTDLRIWAAWDNGAGTGDALQPDTYNPTVSTWTRIVLTNTPPAGATSLNFEIRTYRGATVYLDDFSVLPAGATVATPSFIPGYEDRAVAGTSESVTGLTEGVTYYFRARAENEVGTSPNSPTGSVVTAADNDGDSNDDGGPDDWFSDYGFSPTNEASATIPGSDVTFGEAYMYDVNPGSLPAGFNQVQEMAPMTPDTMGMTINPSSSNRLYDVFYRTDLTDTNWAGFGLDRRGTGGPLTLTVTNDAPIRFYRTGVKMPPAP
jgi:hypothetical protein